MNTTGLSIPEHFSPRAAGSPYESCDWVTRDIAIKDATGKVTFEQEGCEFPAFYSPTSAQIVAGKYFRGKIGTPEREISLRQVIGRVVQRITEWGHAGGYFLTGRDEGNFSRELTYILLHQYASFNSPVWFNLGVPNVEQQASACFILRAEDTLEDWFRLALEEGRIFKRGSGSGVNLTRIRSSWDWLSGGGRPSGPLSLMAILDTGAGQIKSGGVTRRAAKMHVLDVDHPDLLQTREGLPGFVFCKLDQERAAQALITGGFDGGFNVPGGAYSRVSYQNANHSVRAFNHFFHAVEQDWEWSLLDRNRKPVHTLPARQILRQIAEAAWACGDPGMQYGDTINQWHTLPNTGPIEASNPCSEYLSLNETSCLLASLRLTQFLEEDGTFDQTGFEHAVFIMTLALEIMCGFADYPTEAIGRETKRCRNLGLGFCDLGASLMRLGLPYDSTAGRDWAGAVTSLMAATAYRTSGQLAAALGAFHYFEDNRKEMLRVICNHREAAERLYQRSDPAAVPIARQAVDRWNEAVSLGYVDGFRNSQTVVIAPTGTISFMMGADTTGVEPDIALVKVKELAGGGRLTFVNESVPRALYRLGYSALDCQEIHAYAEENGHLEGCELLKPEHLPVFDCAFQAPTGTRSIHYLGHLRMMEAVQPFVSGSISKTVNLPSTATVEDIEQIYIGAWRRGLKCVALYRDGCKGSQPLQAGGKKRKKLPEPGGFRCPQCGHEAAPDKNERCFACENCGYQVGCAV